MKVIFSRKGIDDAYGKGASPIFPNGEMLSIPIPVNGKEKGISYADLPFRELHFQRLIRQLKLPIQRRLCHLDPDLNHTQRLRHDNWKPVLGHHGAAAKHVLNQGVSPGDVFLFFGSFRHVALGKYNCWQFSKDSPKRHVLFGYLRIGLILDLHNKIDRQQAIRLGYLDHPHLLNDYPNTNILFVADEKMDSAGLFQFHDELVLTKAGASKSIWSLPHFFNQLRISRHDNRDRFSVSQDRTILKTVGIGQDFVVEENDELTDWVNALIDRHHRPLSF